MALHKNVANATGRTHWNFVESTTERVNRWPEWKREAVNGAFFTPKPVPQPTTKVSDPAPQED
jgi:hypothetical protein